MRHNRSVIFDRMRAKATQRRQQAEATDNIALTLTEFVATRTGVQAWVEEATGFNKASLLLVAGDGEWLRRVVPDLDWAREFALRASLTCFTAGVDAYPQRMRDWDAAHRRKEV